MLKELITLMSDGDFHSGETLGAHLGVSRAAVWKALKKIELAGYPLDRVKGRGYRIPQGASLLDEGRIYQAFPPSLQPKIKVTVLESVDSTNAHIMRQSHQAPVILACVAEEQLAGRGRRGRNWVSPFAQNIYLSLGMPFEMGAARLGGLSLVVGIAAVRALRSAGYTGIGIKWPNDLLHSGKKLAGILVELSGDLLSDCTAIVGVGINVLMDNSSAIDQPWVSLYQVDRGAILDRNKLVALLLEALIDSLDVFAREGFEAFLQEWAEYDLCMGREVNIVSGDQVVTGVCRGVNGEGQLMLEVEGRILELNGGEVSLRALDAARA